MIPLYPLRFHFRCLDPVYFPAGKPANVLRGAFGLLLRKAACEPGCARAEGCARRDECSYARIFEPAHMDGPSGFADPPRPFVFRALHLDGQRLGANQTFHFGFNLFITEPWPLPPVAHAFRLLEQEGLGPGRGRVRLTGIECAGVHVFEGTQLEGTQWIHRLPPPLTPVSRIPAGTNRIRIDFLTPTELKAQGVLMREPDFAAIFARARDRVANLAAIHGTPLAGLDFADLGARARAIETERVQLNHVEGVERLSGRTGQQHALDGFTGWAIFRGNLDPFLEILAAAEYTGIGRQTVWGKGEIRVTAGSGGSG